MSFCSPLKHKRVITLYKRLFRGASGWDEGDGTYMDRQTFLRKYYFRFWKNQQSVDDLHKPKSLRKKFNFRKFPLSKIGVIVVSGQNIVWFTWSVIKIQKYIFPIPFQLFQVCRSGYILQLWEKDIFLYIYTNIHWKQQKTFYKKLVTSAEKPIEVRNP